MIYLLFATDTTVPGYLSDNFELFEKVPLEVKIMAYVNEDGTIAQSKPFSIFGWLWGILNFCYLFLQTMIDPNFNKHGAKYTRDFRPPGSGPPKPPTKRFGGFGPSGSGPSPPPMGGCGCGG